MHALVGLLLAVLLLPLPARGFDDAAAVPMYAVSLVDSPYRLGGISPEHGLDCSGFVGHVFRQAAGIELPRDTRSLSEATRELATAELQPGDLVFFNTLDRAFSHVGIYLGESRFVHASSRRTGAVRISSLLERYWRERFDGARRVVAGSATQVADARPE